MTQKIAPIQVNTYKRKGICLSIGLNKVDPKKYMGWDGALNACENDANAIANIAKVYGYDTKTLLTKDATKKNVISFIQMAADVLRPNDTFILNYSGHGGQIKDLNGDETDNLDETWCLFDSQILDDEIGSLLSAFKDNVKILVISDSCHSGTVIKQAFVDNKKKKVYKYMPVEIETKVNKKYKKALYASSNQSITPNNKGKQNIILLSGCQDNQFSMDGKINGLFTGTLLNIWNEGKFKGNYKDFHKAIVKQMPPTQTPNILLSGNSVFAFAGQGVFSI